MASFFDTHIAISGQDDWSTGSASAPAVVMSGQTTAGPHRDRGGLNAGGINALVVRCART